jgi:hypothetical protein
MHLNLKGPRMKSGVAESLPRFLNCMESKAFARFLQFWFAGAALSGEGAALGRVYRERADFF